LISVVVDRNGSILIEFVGPLLQDFVGMLIFNFIQKTYYLIHQLEAILL